MNPLSLESHTQAEYFSRQGDLASPNLRNRTVTVVGAGGGAYLAEKLARSVGKIQVVDFDTVEFTNLVRTIYTVDDVGAAKVDALAKRIRLANPFCDVKPMRANVCDLDDQLAGALMGASDLIIAGTDSFLAQARINALSIQYGVPAVFIGLHRRGEGGRIVWSIPGETACYRCVSQPRYKAFENSGDAATDLPGERGLLADVQFVDMVALKVVLAILERDEQSALGAFYRAMHGRTEIIVRTSPAHEYSARAWELLLSDLAQQPQLASELQEFFCAMDTIWLPTNAEPTCVDCGGPA